MRIIQFLFLGVFITSCNLTNNDRSSAPDKQTLANEVRNQTFKQLKEILGLRPIGAGARMMDQIKVLGLNFQYDEEVDIDEARELLMTAGTLLMANVNANERIRPYLENYPFKPNNIRIRIFFEKPNASKDDFDKLSVAVLMDGVLEYRINSSETGRLKTIYEELFEEAKDRLKVNKRI